jgi:hypothetical protein
MKKQSSLQPCDNRLIIEYFQPREAAAEEQAKPPSKPPDPAPQINPHDLQMEPRLHRHKNIVMKGSQFSSNSLFYPQ